MNLKELLTQNKTVGQTVIKNVFWQGVNSIGGRLIRAGIVIYAARSLGTGEYGVFSYAIGVGGLALGLSEFGLLSIMVREVASKEENRDKIISTMFAVRAILGLMAYAAVLIMVPFINPFKTQGYVMVLAIATLSVLLDMTREFFLGTFLALEKAEFQAAINIINNIAILIFGLAALHFGTTALNLAIAYATANALGLSAAIFFSRRFLGEVIRKFDRTLVKPIFRDALPVALMGLSGTFLVYTDTLFLGWLKGANAVGLYSAASRPLQLLYVVPSIFSFTMLPILARRSLQGEGQLERMVEIGLRPLFIIAFPIVAGIFFLAGPVMKILFGPAFLPGFIALKIMSLTIIFLYPAGILSSALLSQNRQKEMAKFMAFGAILNVILNYFLVPRFGIAGAASSTLISQILANIPIYPKVLGWKASLNIAKELQKPFMAVIIMILFLIIAQKIKFNIFASIPGAAIVYFGALILLREPLIKEIRRALIIDPPES